MAEDTGDPDYVRAVFQTVSQPLLVLDADLRVEAANPAFMRKFEVSREGTIGTPVYDLGNGQWDIAELRHLLEEMLPEDHAVENHRIEHEFQYLGTRTMLVSANRMHREGGPDRILLAISDITELEGQKEFAEKLIDSVRESILVLGWDLRVRSANQPFYDCFEVRPEETEGRLVYEIGNGQWNIPELRELLERILPEESSFDDFEVEHDFQHIGRRIMVLNARRLDHIDLIVLAIRDVTEQREQEKRQQTFVGELQHRVKNILNNVRSLAVQTRRGRRDLDGFLEAFEARLAALGRAQDLLIESPREEVSLRKIVRLELGAVGAEENRDFTLDGPLVCLPPRDAQSMAMVVHELATNAGKYGALSSEQGRIEVRWRTETRDEHEHVCFEWRERGVRISDTEPTKGFGSQVIEESLPQMLGGSASLTFHPDGVECVVEFPLPN